MSGSDFTNSEVQINLCTNPMTLYYFNLIDVHTIVRKESYNI